MLASVWSRKLPPPFEPRWQYVLSSITLSTGTHGWRIYTSRTSGKVVTNGGVNQLTSLSSLKKQEVV